MKPPIEYRKKKTIMVQDFGKAQQALNEYNSELIAWREHKRQLKREQVRRYRARLKERKP